MHPLFIPRLKAEQAADQKDHTDGDHHDTANKGQHNGQIRIFLVGSLFSFQTRINAGFTPWRSTTGAMSRDDNHQ
jgi:hypothetical protein